MKKCIYCGAEIASDANFCPECGNGQEPEAEQPENTQQAADGKNNRGPMVNCKRCHAMIAKEIRRWNLPVLSYR